MDGDTGETLIGVNVLVDGTGFGAATGLDGDYRIASVPAGTYDVVFSYLGYDTQRVTGVAVNAGQTTKLDLALTEQALELEGGGEVVVEAEAIRNNDAALLKDRQKSAAVSDAISAETISKSGSSDAADAMERVTGASVQGGQYVFVRGLGDRYANTQLNGAVLPTADPDRRAVQFDLFPSSFLENIVTLKTFTPDKPGSFSGGLVDISTKSFPGTFSASLSASTGFSSQAVPGEGYIVDPVQGASPFRFGAGDLAMPDLIANTARENFLTPTTLVDGPDGAQVLVRNDAAASQRLDDLSNALSAQISPVEGTLPINGSFGLNVGNQIPLGDNLLGFVLSATADQGVSYYDGGTLGRIEVQGLTDDAGNPTGAFSVDTTTVRTDQRSTREAKLGGLANVAFRLGRYNEFNLNTLFSHTTESVARVLDGVDNILSNGARVVDQVAGYEERSLASAQLRGRHNIPRLDGAEVAWRGTYSNTTLDQPDLRFFAIRMQERDGRGRQRDASLQRQRDAAGAPALLPRPRREPRRRLRRRHGAVPLPLPWRGSQGRRLVGADGPGVPRALPLLPAQQPDGPARRRQRRLDRGLPRAWERRHRGHPRPGR